MHAEAAGAPIALRTVSHTYSGRPECVAGVRADLRQVLQDCPSADAVILCASELAANAVRHSDSRKPGGTFTVRAEIRPGSHVRIAVEDAGGRWLAGAADTEGGRGLAVVGALAAGFGIVSTRTGRTVWARLDWHAAASEREHAKAAGSDQ